MVPAITEVRGSLRWHLSIRSVDGAGAAVGAAAVRGALVADTTVGSRIIAARAANHKQGSTSRNNCSSTHF